MATSLTLASARRAWAAAPVPRLPQPIRPIRNVSLPAAWTAGVSPVSRAAPARPAEVVRKSRREVGSLKGRTPCGGNGVGTAMVLLVQPSGNLSSVGLAVRASDAFRAGRGGTVRLP